MPLYKIFICLFILLKPVFSYSQNKPVLQVTVDKHKILLGEPIELSVQLSGPAGKSLRFVNIDTIPHFEFLEKGTIDSSTINNIITVKQVMRITSFDSGRWIIPTFAIPGSRNIKSDTIGIDVGFAAFDATKDYNDIREIIDVPVQKPKSSWYWYLAIGLALLIFIIYLLRKKKPHPVKEPVLIDPYKEAMHQLEQLNKENLPSKGEIKMYYSRLVDIFRFYVYREKKILSLQKTMDDLIIQLKLLKLSTEDYNKLAQALRLADFVKFAKYIPSESDNVEVFSVVKNSIKTIDTKK